MATKKKHGSARRFGARYGRKIRAKVAKVEEAKLKSTLCPYCRKHAVARLSVGIWHCKACKSKFTGRAYTIAKPIVMEEEVNEEVIIEDKEPAEDDDEPAIRAPEKIEKPKEATADG